MKTGEVERVTWYRFEDDPHGYTFHTARYPDGNIITLRADESTWPSLVAEANGIDHYVHMRNATGVEVQQWLDEHPELIVVEVKDMIP